MGFADKVGNGQPPGAYANFHEGYYPIVELRDYVTFNTREKGEAFTATFDILKSAVPTMPAGKRGIDWYQGIDQFPDTAPGAVRAMMAAVSNEELSEINAENVKLIMGSNKPLKGRLVSVTAKKVTTKRNKREIVVATFEPIDMSDEDMEALRVKLRAELGMTDEAPAF